MALAVPFLAGVNRHTNLDMVAALLDKEPKQSLAHAPWKNYSYHPHVQFAMAYCENAILIKYIVQEKHIRAVNSTPNSPVYQDSCVEFFIAFDEGTAYYNFEFNCIGACLAGYGEGRNDRILLPEENIRDIQYKSRISNNPHPALIQWELTLSIPFTAFYHHAINTLKGKKARANFYKCGDELPEPHFVSWSNIEWPEPNFHLSRFFDIIDFRTT